MRKSNSFKLFTNFPQNNHIVVKKHFQKIPKTISIGEKCVERGKKEFPFKDSTLAENRL